MESMMFCNSCNSDIYKYKACESNKKNENDHIRFLHIKEYINKMTTPSRKLRHTAEASLAV